MATATLEKADKAKKIKKTAKTKAAVEKKSKSLATIKTTTVHPISTGYAELDHELAFLSETQIEKLTDFARYLNWSAIIDKDDAEYDEDDDLGHWADLPLTRGEEEAMIRGRENVKNGKYLTLAEFKERISCGN